MRFQSEVAFDLGSLFRAHGSGGTCASVAASVVLETRVAAASFSESVTVALAPEDTLVRIPVRVPGGLAEFDARVLSNDQATVLYSGDASRQIRADGFEVLIDLMATDAVLAACPDTRVLTPAIVNDVPRLTGMLEVVNVGSEATPWDVRLEPTPPCDGCLALTTDGSLAPGDTLFVFANADPASTAGSYDVVLDSDVGSLDLHFVIE